MPAFLPALFAVALLLQDQPPQDWASLDRQAEDLYTKGDLKEAIRVANLAVDAASGAQQSGHSIDRLGFFEYTSGDYKNGEQHLRQAFELRKRSGRRHRRLCRERQRPGALLPRLREVAGRPNARRAGCGDPVALAGRRRSTRGREPRYAGQHRRVPGRLRSGDLQIRGGARAFTRRNPTPTSLGEEYGTLCINLAGTYQRAGKYAQSEALFTKGLDVLRRKPGVNHPAYSASLVAYAFLQADLGHYSVAEKLYDESGKLLLEQLGEQHPVYTTYLNNRAALYTALGNFTVAEADHRKALELKRKIYGPDALTVGASLRNLAHLVSLRNRAEGEKLYQEAVDLYAKNPKAPPFDYTSALLGLSEAQRNRGDLAAARATLQHRLRCRRQRPGHEAPAICRCALRSRPGPPGGA